MTKAELSFNTSHVVVYLILILQCLILFHCFNTSHVVVYPIQPHSHTAEYQFQYISCCSLSFNNLANGYAVH